MVKNEWQYIGEKVDLQNTKQRIYDDILLDFCKDDIKEKSVFDFGCGTGEIIQRVSTLANDVRAYDESEEMRRLTSEKIGGGRCTTL